MWHLSHTINVTDASQDENRNSWESWEMHWKHIIPTQVILVIKLIYKLTEADHVPYIGFWGGAENHVDQPEGVKNLDAHPGERGE